jgi:hypothetical protein
VEDTPVSLASLFSNEVSTEHFEPELIIKDPREVEKVKEVLLENFDTICNYYMVKLDASEKYPKLDYLSIMAIKEDIAKTTQEPIIIQE